MDRSARSILGMVAFVVFVDMLGIGLILPVMPDLIREVSAANVSRAAEIGGVLLFVYALMQFLFAPVIGGLSDRFGRRPVLLITLTALGLDYLLMAFAPTLSWLFLGRVISGVMGATWAAANSCIADCVPREERGSAFGIMGAAGAAGFVFGPAIGGVLGEFGTRLPFIAAAAMALSGAAVGFFILVETLPPERRRSFSVARANPLGSILHLSHNRFVIGCLVTLFFMQLGAQAQLSIWAYWGTLQHGWTPLTNGLSVAFYGTMIAVMQGVLTGRAIARFGASRTARYGLLFAIPSYLLLAFSPWIGGVILAIIIGSITGIVFPAMQSRMTVKVEEDAQGELQGAIASVIALTAIIGPIMMTQIFGHFTDGRGLFFPGAPYIVSCGLTLLAIGVLWRVFSRDDAGEAKVVTAPQL